MTEVSSSASPESSVPANIFRDSEHVHEALPAGPQFGDDVWDFGELARMNQRSKKFGIGTIPGSYGVTARHLLMVKGRPTHPKVMECGIVVSARPAPYVDLIDTGYILRTLATWGVARNLGSFSAWRQDHLDALLEDLHAGNHRPDGEVLSATTIRGFVTVIKTLHLQAAVIPGSLSFEPWPNRSAARVAGEVRRNENVTLPLPWDTWRPLIAAAATFVDRFSVDIIAADRALRAAPTSPQLNRGLTGETAVQALRDFFAAGGHVPLHTGFGKSGASARGTVNLAMTQRLAGVSGNIFKPAHRAYMPEARTVIDQAAARGQGVHGGLFLPQVTVDSAIGTPKTWIDEIGMGEAEFLPNLLRAAAYIFIASMSGMRDSEIQELRSNCLGTENGLTVFYSTQFKGCESDGEDRYWWVPDILVRAIEVLTELSLNDELFARAPRAGARENPGPFLPPVFIDRLIEFVNADPAIRAGRGDGLALERIAVPKKQSVHATSLRRSYSVFAATHPEAVIGLGINLGHSALRQTTAYGSDGTQTAVKRLNKDREFVAREQVQRLIESGGPIEGRAAEDLRAIRAQIIVDPVRAEKIMDQVAEHYHAGLTNDCFYRAGQAACGPDGPHLASQFCATTRCANALVHSSHLPLLQAQILRLDKILNRPRVHPALEISIREQRVHLSAVIANISNDSEGVA